MTTSHNRGGLRHHSYPANQMDNTNHRENESPVAKPLRRASQPPTNREAAARLDPRVRKESILSTLNAMNRTSPADDKNKLSAVPDHDEVTMATLRERFRKSVSVAPDLASLDVNPNSNQRRKSSHTMTSGTLFAVMHARKHFRYKNREIRKKKLCILFRAIARVAILLNRICAWHYQRIKEVGNKNLTFSELHEDPQVELMFDVTKYKANKELRISKEAKHILMKTPSERTEHELYLVTIALRNVKSIAEYPVRMQRSVAEVGWYEAYDAKRVIVREGQPPISFYFLLSGSAVVTIMDREKELATTVAIIKRGDSFGELAILNGSTRTSSVTARENVEMICISAQDFTRIFMSGGAKNLVDPDHNSFIKSIEFLKGWPLHLLAERPNMCIFNYFTSCTVLVRDSRQSNWIYIVKSGSCSVLKRLHQVKPRRKTGKRKRSFQEDTDTDDNHRDRLDQKVTTLLSKKKIDLKRNTVAKYDMPLVSTNVDCDFESVPPTRLASAASVISTNRLPTANHHRNQPMESRRKKSKEEHSFSGAYRTDDAITDDRHSNWSFAKGPFLTRSKYDTSAKSTADYRAAELVSLSADGDCLVGNTRTLPDDLNIGYKADDTFAGKKPIFVRVQTLVKGAVFGLADVLFDEQPSLSLVSNGAECIVISKRLFMDHASDDLITKLRLEERPYITDEEMQHNLERQLHWNGFRKTTLQKAALVVKQRRRERRNRRHTLGVLT